MIHQEMVMYIGQSTKDVAIMKCNNAHLPPPTPQHRYTIAKKRKSAATPSGNVGTFNVRDDYGKNEALVSTCLPYTQQDVRSHKSFGNQHNNKLMIHKINQHILKHLGTTLNNNDKCKKTNKFR